MKAILGEVTAVDANRRTFTVTTLIKRGGQERAK
jgi:hypothetical protein